MPTALCMRSLFAVLVLCVLAGVPAFAQMETATLSGVISDPNGGVVTDVEVIATRIETGNAVTTKTNGAGIYFFTGLVPGHYHLTVRKPGFKEIAIKEFQLYVQDKLEQNFSLEIGSVSETVTVNGTNPLVNTTDGSVSTVIDRQFVENIPLNGQSFNTLMLLTPGVVIVPYSNTDTPGQFSVNGQRTDGNYFRVDGVGANFGTSITGFAGAGGTQALNAYGGTASLVSVDALQEFRVETSSFSPEYGRTPGGQVSISTRPGTSQFHGDVFDYFRNTVLDANDWFANKAGLPRAPEHQNDFGGVVGGPIVPKKTFFFLSYEGLRLRQPQTQIVQVPSVSVRQAAIPAAAAILNAFPLPDPKEPVSPDGTTAQLTGNYSNNITLDAVSLRIDQLIGSKVTLFGRFNYSPSEFVTRIDSLSTIQNQPVDTTTFTVGLNAQLTTNATNSFRFNYSKQKAGQTWKLDSFGGAVPISPQLLLPAVYPVSNSSALLSTSTDFGFFNLNVGTGFNSRVSQWLVADDVSVLKGTHQLKFGADYTKLLASTVGQGAAPKYYTFSTADFQKFVSNGTVPDFANVAINPSKILLSELSLYAQDRWSIGKRLTLTYGLRWEFNPTPTAENSILASWQNTSNPANLALAPAGTPIWNTTYVNFAPRLGIAYQPTPKGDLVIRAGTGVFYDLGTTLVPSLGTEFPNSASFADFSGAKAYPVPISNTAAVTPSFSLTPPYSGNIFGFSDNLKLPYSYQWNVAIEKSFQGNQSVSATYLGQAGRRLLRHEVIPKPNPNFSSVFQLTENGDVSNYNALQLQYKKRVSHGLEALLNYTWSHSIDTNSDATNNTIPGTLLPIGGDRGTSDFDVRHSFSGAFVYTAPSLKSNVFLRKLTEGWSLSSFVFVRTGFPINIRTFKVLGGFAYSARPDLVPGQPIWIENAGAAGGKVLNFNAFATPSTFRQGTLPRNFVPGFGATQIDTSLGRNFGITERIHLQFRADVFNVFNHPNFANPNGSLFNKRRFGTTTQMLNRGISSNGAGLNALYSIGGPRSMQISLKLFF